MITNNNCSHYLYLIEMNCNFIYCFFSSPDQAKSTLISELFASPDQTNPCLTKARNPLLLKTERTFIVLWRISLKIIWFVMAKMKNTNGRMSANMVLAQNLANLRMETIFSSAKCIVSIIPNPILETKW